MLSFWLGGICVAMGPINCVLWSWWMIVMEFKGHGNMIKYECVSDNGSMRNASMNGVEFYEYKLV